MDHGSEWPAARPPWRAALVPVLAMACLLGLFTSFRYHFAIWGIDGDTAVSAVVWEGFRRHGLAFLHLWSYTPDNWLLTILAPTFFLYELVGAKPMLVVGLGWVAFLANAGLAATIGAMLGGRIAGLAVAASLLLASQDAMGWVGFLSHPVSHDISLLWGLFSVVLMAYWLRRGGYGWLAGSFLALLADCISDPWALVAFALPMAAGAAVAGSAAAVAVAVATGAIAWTRAFGLLDFLPRNAVEIADPTVFLENAWWMCRSIGALFNPVPFVPHPQGGTAIATCAILAMLLGTAAWACLRMARTWLAAERFLLIAGGLSAVLPIAAFLVCRFPLAINVGRFAVSCYVFVPVLLFSAMARGGTALPRWTRIAIPAFFTLMGAAGLASNPDAWRHPWPGLITHDVPGLSAFLKTNGLAYGYGAYWGSQANAVTWVSDGTITIRPVHFDNTTGWLTGPSGQSAAIWYTPADVPAGQTLFFVVVKDDDEYCPHPDICIAGLQSQFGPAISRLVYRDDITILVWDHPLRIPS